MSYTNSLTPERDWYYTVDEDSGKERMESPLGDMDTESKFKFADRVVSDFAPDQIGMIVGCKSNEDGSRSYKVRFPNPATTDDDDQDEYELLGEYELEFANAVPSWTPVERHSL